MTEFFYGGTPYVKERSQNDRSIDQRRDAPGMNAAIRAVVRTAINKGLKVKGIMRGYAGLLQEEIVDMDSVSVADTINRGGTILYTARCENSRLRKARSAALRYVRNMVSMVSL